MVHTYNLKSLYTVFLHGIKFIEYRMGINFDKDLSSVEQNNYATKNVDTCIAYDLDAWPRNSTKKILL